MTLTFNMIHIFYYLYSLTEKPLISSHCDNLRFVCTNLENHVTEKKSHLIACSVTGNFRHEMVCLLLDYYITGT